MTALDSHPAQRASPVDDSERPPHAAELHRVGVRLGRARIPVLEEVSLTVHHGELLGLAGPNGAGKSTLLRVLATLLPPDRGRAEVFGTSVTAANDSGVRRRICLVAHEPGLHPALTLGENLELIRDLHPRRRDGDRGEGPGPAVRDALVAVGLAAAADRPVTACSRGMVRRAELARVLVTAPQLLLLDEAHAGLDAASAELVAAVVGRVRAGGGAAVVVSHDGGRLTDVVDRTVELDAGRIATGSGA